MKSSILNISWPFLIFHLVGIFGVILTPFSWYWLSFGIGTYFFKTFFLTAGYHRYFTHKSFEMNRFWQFIFAFLGATNGQKSALWWAAGHRYHHKFSDTPEDIHSPLHQKWESHGGWVLLKKHTELKTEFIPDLLKFPELVWLHKYQFLPIFSWTILMFIVGGWNAILWGTFISSLMNWHGTFIVNSLSHIWGSQPFESNDNSRNSFIIALLTMGEGWHNNHHAYSKSANHGFYWWQIDITFYLLKILEKIKIVKNLHIAPVDKIPKKIKEKQQFSL